MCEFLAEPLDVSSVIEELTQQKLREQQLEEQERRKNEQMQQKVQQMRENFLKRRPNMQAASSVGNTSNSLYVSH